MQNIRNIAIIAHVDHGKTTLVDKMLYTAKVVSSQHSEFSDQPRELILDNNDLERERGITILAKNVSIDYKGTKINIIDTPGHADFGGEVERVLNMADGVLLLVDAFEGAMPQTRFVLQKALEIGLKPIVVINKVDKLNCRPDEVQEEVFDLMCNLNATDEQLDFQTLYGSAKQGWMSTDWRKPTSDLTDLMDAIIEYIPAPQENPGTPQMLITSLDYNSYVGRIAIGRVHRGELRDGQAVTLVKVPRDKGQSTKGQSDQVPRDKGQSTKDSLEGCTLIKTKIKELHTFSGMGHVKTDVVKNGDICALIGIDGFEIGDTVCDAEHPEPLKPIAIDEPTMSMTFCINDSPFFGQDGKFVTSRHIQERLNKELEKNLALRVEKGAEESSWRVFGRGVLHLSVLIETMRREGYELQVGQPQVIIKEIDGVKCEPVESLTVNTPEECSGKIIEFVSTHKGEMTKMEMVNDRVHLEFTIPSRGIMGMRTYVMNVSAGEAIMAHRFLEYQPWKGEIVKRTNGSLIAMEAGTAYAYALDKLQDRGRFFIEPQEEVYAGQVVGENAKEGDIVINVTKSKKLTNMRSKSADDKAVLPPPVKMSLEEALEYIKEDEYVEVTPHAMRIRKIILDELERKRAGRA